MRFLFLFLTLFLSSPIHAFISVQLGRPFLYTNTLSLLSGKSYPSATEQQMYRGMQNPYAVLNVGVPPKPFLLILDTGSSTTELPRYDCQSCNSTRTYNPTASTGALEVDCKVANSLGAWCTACEYGSGSSSCMLSRHYNEGLEVEGVFSADTVSVGAVNASAVFAAITTIKPSGRFSSVGLDGVWGLGTKVLNNEWPTVLDFVWSTAGMQRAFGIGLGDVDQCNGQLTVGGVDDRLYSGKLHAMPLLNNTNHYGLQIDSITWGSNRTITNKELTDHVTIIDSGTTDILVPSDTMSSITFAATLTFVDDSPDEWQTIMWNNNYVHNMTWSPPTSWPNVTLNTRSGYKIILKPTDYIVKAFLTDGTKAWMNAFRSSGLSELVLGAAAMQTTYWVFDLDHNNLLVAPMKPQPRQTDCPHKNWA